jgi:hypothetical protein
MPRVASSGHDQTISTGVGPIFPQLVPPQLYPECLRFRLSLLVCSQIQRNIRISATQLLDMLSLCRSTFNTV